MEDLGIKLQIGFRIRHSSGVDDNTGVTSDFATLARVLIELGMQHTIIKHLIQRSALSPSMFGVSRVLRRNFRGHAVAKLSVIQPGVCYI